MEQYRYKYLEFQDNNTFNIKEECINIGIEEYDKEKKLGVMIVGICGNNGSTFTAGILANKKNIMFENKNGVHPINFYGSISQYGTINLGYNKKGEIVSKLIKDMINIRNPNEIIISGWDIVDTNLYDASKKNKILEPSLLLQLKDDLQNIKPLPSIYYKNFIATNQELKCNNIKNDKSKWKDICNIKNDIIDFKLKNDLEKVIVIWSGSTERFNNLDNSLTAGQLFDKIFNDDIEISPSMIFAVASILSGSIFINTSPQNTIIPAIIELANEYGTFVAGDDLKSGQTKLKSVLVDYLASSGIKPLSIVSYNHLGNNDGLNLSESPQFKSKELTKRSVIDDVVEENPILFNGKKPDHEVIIKYVPAVNDSKRAIDEYYSQLFLDGKNILSIYNVCEDTLLAVPIILDIILFADLFSRTIFKKDDNIFKFSNNLSLLSFFFKAPINDNKQPIINSFFKQRYALENFIKICNGIPINDFINFHNRF